MELILFLVGLAVSGAAAIGGAVYNELVTKPQARESANKVKSDLDTLLGTEQGKLTTEFTAQKSRLEDYTTEVLGSQRQGFAVRGDFGGRDTAAANVITATENKAAEDQDLLGKSYQAGMTTLAQQTQLAKDQVDQGLNQYLNGVTAQEISSIAGFVGTSIAALGSMKLPAAGGKAAPAPTVMDAPYVGGGYSYGAMPGWDPIVGIPRLY